MALKETVPLIFWGEPSAEYTAYYSYDDAEEVNEERFNKYINPGYLLTTCLYDLVKY